MRKANNKNVKKLFEPTLFWDARARDIDLKKHSHYVIARVLDFGGVKDVNTLRSIYSDDEIIEVIKTRRGLEDETAIFWATYFKIPFGNVKCLRRRSLVPRYL